MSPRYTHLAGGESPDTRPLQAARPERQRQRAVGCTDGKGAAGAAKEADAEQMIFELEHIGPERLESRSTWRWGK